AARSKGWSAVEHADGLEAPIDKRRIKRRKQHQPDDGNRDAEPDERIRDERLHAHRPKNIKPIIRRAVARSVMNGTQPTATKKNVTATLVADASRDRYHAWSEIAAGIFVRITW